MSETGAFDKVREAVDGETLSAQERNRLWWEKMPMTYVDWDSPDRAARMAEHFAHAEQVLLGASPFLRECFDWKALAGLDILDLGCGSGVLSCVAARHGARVTAADLTDEAVRMARANAESQNLSVNVVRTDAEKMGFAEASFDYVLSWGVLHHSSNTEQALREVGRILRPGGRGLMMVYHKASLFYWLKGLFWLIFKGKIFQGHSIESVQDFYVDGYYHRHFTGSELAASLAQGGLRAVKVYATQQQEPILPGLPSGRLDEWLKHRFGWYLVAEFEKPKA